jgi:hypothetical protein
MWQQDLKVQPYQYQSPALDMILNQLSPPTVLTIHLPKTFLTVVYPTKNLMFLPVIFQELPRKTPCFHIFVD